MNRCPFLSPNVTAQFAIVQFPELSIIRSGNLWLVLPQSYRRNFSFGHFNIIRFAKPHRPFCQIAIVDGL